jgi:hemerythrin
MSIQLSGDTIPALRLTRDRVAMAFIEWTSDLDTGIGWVDEQHRKIVDCINDLHAVDRASGTRDSVSDVMGRLIAYTRYHFSEEEKMLERAGYRLLETHQGIHRGFIDKLHTIHEQYRRGADTLTSLLALLENWLFSHIRVHDRGYVATVKSAGADRL